MTSKYLHYGDCRCGTRGLRPLTKEDTWWVNAPEYWNCFWVYLRHNTRPHTLNEIGDKLDLSISAITTIERRAFQRLRKKVRNFVSVPKNDKKMQS